jgi:hypothetical protein
MRRSAVLWRSTFWDDVALPIAIAVVLYIACAAVVHP